MERGVLVRILMAAGLALSAGSAVAAVTVSDADLAKRVRHELAMYPRYTIWDDVSFSVADGQVELIGAVSQPFKKDDIERTVRAIPGVTGVSDARHLRRPGVPAVRRNALAAGAYHRGQRPRHPDRRGSHGFREEHRRRPRLGSRFELRHGDQQSASGTPRQKELTSGIPPTEGGRFTCGRLCQLKTGPQFFSPRSSRLMPPDLGRADGYPASASITARGFRSITVR